MMTRALTVTGLVVVLTAGLGITQAAAWEFYMTITGGQQGKFAGELSTQGWEHAMGCVALSGDVQAPFAGGGVGGAAAMTVKYMPLTVTKAWGAASPQIFRALVTGEILKQVVMKFLQTTPTGQREVYYTITLSNAVVTALHLHVGEAATAAVAQAARPELEDVSFRYEAITVQSMLTGAQAGGGVNGPLKEAGPGQEQGPGASVAPQTEINRRVPRTRRLEGQ
jgi:type VI secretion system secreted protein Hcp